MSTRICSHKNYERESEKQPSLLVSFSFLGRSISNLNLNLFHRFEFAYKHPTYFRRWYHTYESTKSRILIKPVVPFYEFYPVENVCDICIIMLLQCCGKTILCFMNRKSFLGEHQNIPLNAWQYFCSSCTASRKRRKRSIFIFCQIFIFLSNVDLPQTEFQTVKKSKMKKNYTAQMTLTVFTGENAEINCTLNLFVLWFYRLNSNQELSKAEIFTQEQQCISNQHPKIHILSRCPGTN